VKRKPTFLAFLLLQMEVANNPSTSPLLLFLTHSLLQLARELRYEMELYSSCYCVVSFPSVFSLEGGCPSIYTRRRGGDVAIPSVKPKHHRLLHGGMQPPREGEDERCKQGGDRPLTTASGHCLHMAGHGLDLHCSLVEFCFV
jgi:hypothetical protein